MYNPNIICKAYSMFLLHNNTFLYSVSRLDYDIGVWLVSLVP